MRSFLFSSKAQITNTKSSDFIDRSTKCMKWFCVVMLACTSFAIKVIAQERSSYKVIIIGDSITEGYGVAKEKAYPALLMNQLNSSTNQKIPVKNYQVINAGIAGATTAGCLQRVQWSFKSGKADLVILALGANDGLRGLQPMQSEKNLSDAIQWVKEQKSKVILFGMQMPPNYGGKYRKEFEKIYTHLQTKHKIDLLPLFIKDVAGRPELNQADGIHPNEKGHEIIAKTVLQFLEGKL